MTINDLVERVKAILHPLATDENFAWRVGQESFVALEELGRACAKDSNLRNYFLTDPATTTATLDSEGTANLASLVSSQNILLDCLQYGDIIPPSGYPSTQPMRVIANHSQGRIAGGLDALVYKCWLEGTYLNTKSPDNNVTALSGNISLRVPYVPNLSQISGEVLTGMLVDILVRRMNGKVVTASEPSNN